jgi:hypothetical protein
MEPSGRNRWQTVANGSPPKTAQTRRLATGGNPRHGKEGVNGSSPLEGFTKSLQISSFWLGTGPPSGVPASTERPPPFGTDCYEDSNG